MPSSCDCRKAFQVPSKKAYTVWAALRGPDEAGVTAGQVKTLTTAVLRYYVGVPLHKWGAITTTPKFAIRYLNALPLQPARRAEIVKWLQKNSHFRVHWVNAMVLVQAKPYLRKLSKALNKPTNWLICDADEV